MKHQNKQAAYRNKRRGVVLERVEDDLNILFPYLFRGG